MEVVERTGGIADGARMVARVGPGPFKLTWVADHREHIPGRQFVDEQTSGPFAHWVHKHLFLEEGPQQCHMRDEVQYKLPLGPLGQAVAGSYVRKRLDRMFDFRHMRLNRDMALHREYSTSKRLKVAISGASGVLGTALTALLTTGGHTVLPMVRRKASGPHEIAWDPRAGTIEAEKLEGVDAVIHLAGAGVADKKWTPERKRLILDSRVQGTTLIAKALTRLKDPPSVMLSASAVGYYGHRPQETVTEASDPGQGFLSEVCQAWEQATAPLDDTNIRLVKMRIGVVLTPTGGALKEMLLPFSLGVGGPVGDGEQWMSWVGLDDTLQIFYRALFEGDIHGPINVVAPNPVTQREFASTLARVLRRPAVLPLPAVAVRGLFGEMGQRVLLEGARVLPAKLQQRQHPFYHRTLEDTLRESLGR
jgi:uncharacterized protein (TIGR01777 family)